MQAALLQLLRSRWFSFTMHAALWLLLYFAAVNLGGKAPAFREGPGPAMPITATVPIAKVDALFAPGALRNALLAPTNMANPFYTTHFVPPAPAPPPPPTTRKLEVTYQGFYQSGDGPKYAVLNLAGGLMVTQVGGLVATNVYVADAELMSVVLTNTTKQTNTLTLNSKKEIEVPIR